MYKIYDLENVLISKRIQETWQVFCQGAVGELLKKYPDLGIKEIKDEILRVNPCGTGEIYLRVRDAELKLKVPKDEFVIKTDIQINNFRKQKPKK